MIEIGTNCIFPTALLQCILLQKKKEKEKEKERKKNQQQQQQQQQQQNTQFCLETYMSLIACGYIHLKDFIISFCVPIIFVIHPSVQSRFTMIKCSNF